MSTTPVVLDATTQPPLLCLQPEERRRILLESLRESGHPRVPKEASRPVTKDASRYVSQFTSGRWRERIWNSDDSDEDMPSESATEGDSQQSRQLIIYGYDLHCNEYLKEREMINRWNIGERELHFPNMEKGYLEKRDAKTSSKLGPFNPRKNATAKITVRESTTEDVPMEECQNSPKDTGTSTEIGGKESTSGATALESDVQKHPGGITEVVEQDKRLTTESESKDQDTLGEIKDLPEQESDKKSVADPVPLEKMLTVSGNSEVVKRPENEMETSETTSPSGSSVAGQSSAPIHEILVPKNKIEPEDSKVTKSPETQMETSEVTLSPPGSGDPKSESSVLEDKSADKMEATTGDSKEASSETTSQAESSSILESNESADKTEILNVPGYSKVESSETVMENSGMTSPAESPDLPESKEYTDKTEVLNVPGDSKVAKISETDMEISGTTLRGKRKADSSSVDDPEEKRTKKTSDEK